MSTRAYLVLLLTLAASSWAAPIGRPTAGEPDVGASGDIVKLAAQYPEALWLPLSVTPQGNLLTSATINGKPLRVRISTASAANYISERAANDAGLMSPIVTRIPRTVHFGPRKVELLVAETLVTFGPVEFPSVGMAIVREGDGASLVGDADAVIGYDLVSHTDLLFALDQGALGVFAEGTGKLTRNDRKGSLVVVQRDLSKMPAGQEGKVTLAGNAFLPIAVEDKVRPLLLHIDSPWSTWPDPTREIGQLVVGGAVDVGTVTLRHAAGAAAGNEMLLRTRTLLSFKKGELRVAPIPHRPPTRAGPGGKKCAPSAACVTVSVDETEGRPCLAVSIDGSWATPVGGYATLLVDVVDADGHSAIPGTFFSVYTSVGAGGERFCIDPALTFARYQIAKGTRTSLLRFAVVDHAPCEKLPCAYPTLPPD